MRELTRIGLDGKEYTFNVHDDHFIEGEGDVKKLFEPYPKAKACVLWTQIIHDCGYKDVEYFGFYRREPYDNGLEGYLGGEFFDDVAEARRVYEIAKGFVPKVGTVAYCDVIMVENV